MVNLRRKVIAVFFTLVFLASVVVIPGCKQSQPAPKKTTKQKVPADLQ